MFHMWYLPKKSLSANFIRKSKKEQFNLIDTAIQGCPGGEQFYGSLSSGSGSRERSRAGAEIFGRGAGAGADILSRVFSIFVKNRQKMVKLVQNG